MPKISYCVHVMMSAKQDRAELERAQAEQVFALNDLLEVEACLREMLQTGSDPAVLQRLYSLHREIQRYVAEVQAKKSDH